MTSKLYIDKETQERVFPLVCTCGSQGGEVRFPEAHGRESDAALEAELNALYVHTCESHQT